MKKDKFIKLMLEYELFEKEIFCSSNNDFFQNYLEFLYLNRGEDDENELGEEDSN